jgi:acyl-CoA hydrolase
MPVKTLDISRIGEALQGLPAVPRVVATGNYGTPWTLLDAIDKTLPTYRFNTLNPMKGVPDREGVILETSFVGPGMRKNPRMIYYPSRLSLVPRLFFSTLPPDVVLVHTSVPKDGTVSLGIEINVLPAAIEAAKARGGRVIAQMNPRMPYTYGDAVIKLEDIDFAVEVDVPLSTHAIAPLDDTSLSIGKTAADRITDGASLQLGIGAVPDAVLHSLTERRGLKVWSEMISDGVMALERKGCMDPDTPLTCSFLFGSEELYEWVDSNPRVLLLRTETTNDPANISSRPLMTSINTALQIDLFAQANASRIKARIHSGFGGQTDFIVGALHSEGGQSIMALRSWHPKANVSTIVPLVDEPVTSFQPSAVITEQGAAQIYGHDEKTQAANIITNAAHPSIREELWEEAAGLGLV